MIGTELALLLLGDGRFPAGGHAHSAGVEAAVADGRISDEWGLEDYVRGRLVTVGLVDAALATTTTAHLDATPAAGSSRALAALDGEADARILVPALRDTSRRLGRQLARAAARCWPDALFVELTDRFPAGAHQSVALGVAGRVVGATPGQVAALSVHHAITTPAQAGVRILGLDPFGVAAIVARLAPLATDVVADAVAAADDAVGGGSLADLPARSAPLADIAATDHAGWDVRLFAT